MKISGACQCGSITIEGEVNPENVRVCHCTDCQKNSGSAFRFNVPVPGDKFKITGEPAIYIKNTAESGRPRAQAFCPKCGSPIYTTSVGEGQQASYMIRAGILAARTAETQAADLVSLRTIVGHCPGHRSEGRESKLTHDGIHTNARMERPPEQLSLKGIRPPVVNAVSYKTCFWHKADVTRLL
jgi:hypothetical protein